MSMVKCKDCGAMVSDSATKCPQCGQDLRQNGAGCGLIVFSWFLTIIGGIQVLTYDGSFLWWVPAIVVFAFGFWLFINQPSQTE